MFNIFQHKKKPAQPMVDGKILSVRDLEIFNDLKRKEYPLLLLLAKNYSADEWGGKIIREAMKTHPHRHLHEPDQSN